MKNILEYLEQTAENHPDKIGFTDEHRDVTFSELMQTAQRITGSLARIGCRKPVAVLIDRNMKCIESMFAAVFAELIVLYEDAVLREIDRQHLPKKYCDA